jgi:CRISPR-associated protein Cas2
MVVMIFENVPASLRGKLSRWMIEPRAGVFVGKLSALVRDELWKMCLETRSIGGMIQVWSSANEQGFDARMFGETSRQLVDHEGLLLVRRKQRKSLPNREHRPDAGHQEENSS